MEDWADDLKVEDCAFLKFRRLDKHKALDFISHIATFFDVTYGQMICNEMCWQTVSWQVCNNRAGRVFYKKRQPYTTNLNCTDFPYGFTLYHFRHT